MHAQVAIRSIPVSRSRVACTSCNLSHLCLAEGLTSREIELLDATISRKRRLKRGEALYRAGNPFRSLYAIRSGSFKSSVVSEDGREQVTGFYMTGDIMGADAISADMHPGNAVALEDSDTCEIPYAPLVSLTGEIPSLRRQIFKLISREIQHDHGVMLLLGSMRAWERLAVFLLNLSQRFSTRRFSPTRFVLRMTREEIGSYLGLKLETVSRTLSKFQEEGLIAIESKTIEIKDLHRMKRLIGQNEYVH